jgi:hypothetical protein
MFRKKYVYLSSRHLSYNYMGRNAHLISSSDEHVIPSLQTRQDSRITSVFHAVFPFTASYNRALPIDDEGKKKITR